MAQVVRSKLPLKTILRLTIGNGHHTSIIKEQIEVSVIGPKTFSKGAYRGKRGQV